MSSRYYTDGFNLYEVLARQTVQNYGLKKGVFNYVIVQDVISERTGTLDDLHLSALTEVQSGSPSC